MTRKILSTLVLLALFAAGAALASHAWVLAHDQCVLIASESTCRLPMRAVLGLLVFVVSYFGMKSIWKIWPPKGDAEDEQAG